MSLYACHLVWRDAWWGPFATVAVILTSQYVSYWSLLHVPARGKPIRRSLLLVALYFWYDFTFNPAISFGSRLRDTALGIISWNLLARTLTIGLSFDRTGVKPPRWIVPDWRAESESRGQMSKAVTARSQVASQRWRKQLPLRPAWAREGKVIPRFWREIDYPTGLADQALWALDVWLYRRPCTSFWYFEELRSLEWSQKKLERAGQDQYNKRTGNQIATHELDLSVEAYGRFETSPFNVFLDVVLMAACHRYLTSIHLSGITFANFFHLPVVQRLMITSSMGCCISTFLSAIDYILVPVSQAWPLRLPVTAVMPLCRDVGRSRSLTELWSSRWHTLYRRDFLALVPFIPLGKPSHRVATLLKVFFWSGVMHTMTFVHLAPEPSFKDPLSLLRPFVWSGAMTFFMLQGALVILEQVWTPYIWSMIGRPTVRTSQWRRVAIEKAQQVWVWSALTLSAQFLAAEVVSWDLLVQDQIISMRPMTQLSEFYAFFRKNLT